MSQGNTSIYINDLFCMNDVTIESNTSQIINVGLVLFQRKNPYNLYVPIICDRIDVVLKKHCQVLGEILGENPSSKESIKVILFNFDNNESIHFQKGDPIAQIHFFRILIPELIPQDGFRINRNFHTIRGDRGFGELTKDFLHEKSQENTSVIVDTCTTSTNNNSSSSEDLFRQENLIIEFLQTSNDAIMPRRLPPDYIGYNLFCVNDFTIESNTSQILDTGIVLLLDPNARYFPKICDKSSVVLEKHCRVLGGILDPGYRGSIKVILFNYDNNETIHFKRGDEIARILFFPVLLPKLNLTRHDDDFTGNIVNDSLQAKAEGTNNNNNKYNNSIIGGDGSGDFVGEINLTIDVLKNFKDAIIPIRLSPDSVGYDLFCMYDFEIKKNKIKIIDTGVVLCRNLHNPNQYYPKICDKSSVVWKKYCHVLGGFTEHCYKETVKVILFNYDNNKTIYFKKGDPIAQIVFFPRLYPCEILRDE